MGHTNRRLPAQGTLPYQLLALTAVCGEFPTSQLTRLSGGSAYKENVVKALKREGLLKTYYRDGARGFRLTAAAKQLLAVERPEWFASYLSGRSEPNMLKSEISRRLRLHRMAEVLVTMLLAGIPALGWEKPPLFQASSVGLTNSPLEVPVYYSSREVKEIGPLAIKVKNSRAVGILLTDCSIFMIYNTAASRMKWEYKAELRLQALLRTELCQGSQFAEAEISGVVFGTSMEQMLPFLGCSGDGTRDCFVMDGTLAHFYFLTNDHHGEVILRLLSTPELKGILDEILSEDLADARPGWGVEHDAVAEGDMPVLFAYTCDMPRIRRFDTALELRGLSGILICFDFQAEILRVSCGPRVRLQSIDFTLFERGLLHS